MSNFTLHPNLKRDGIVVGRFPLSLVLLINDSHYPWFVLVPRRDGLRDPHDMTQEDYSQFWSESRIFGQAILKAFDGDKLNVAALGNMTPQLHVHHIVRRKTDAAWPGAIWGVHPLKPYDKQALETLRETLASARIESFILS